MGNAALISVKQHCGKQMVGLKIHPFENPENKHETIPRLQTRLVADEGWVLGKDCGHFVSIIVGVAEFPSVMGTLVMFQKNCRKTKSIVEQRVHSGSVNLGFVPIRGVLGPDPT